MEERGVHLFCISVVRLRHVFVECLLNVSQSFRGLGPEKDVFAATDAFAANKHFFLKNQTHISVYLVPSDSSPQRDLEEDLSPLKTVPSRATKRWGGMGKEIFRGLNLDQSLIHEDISVWCGGQGSLGEPQLSLSFPGDQAQDTRSGSFTADRRGPPDGSRILGKQEELHF